MTVDYVDDEIFETLKDLLEAAFDDSQLGVCFFRALLSGSSIKTGSGSRPALSAIWSDDENHIDVVQILDDDGACTSQTSYAYHHDKPLWIVAADDGRLSRSDADNVQDLWSRAADLPVYSDYGGGDARTSILLPLEYGTRVFGVLNIEFKKVIPISSRAKTIAMDFADALARITWLNETNNTQLDDTRKALQQLESGKEAALDGLLARTVFVASSSKADQDVMQAIMAVLDEFADLFDVKLWQDERASGGHQRAGARSYSSGGVWRLLHVRTDERGDRRQALRRQSQCSVRSWNVSDAARAARRSQR